MEELKVFDDGMVPVYETSTGEKVVYGTDLHKVLGSKRQYTDWIKSRFSECDAIEKEDYEGFSQNCEKPTGGRPKHEYIIKLDVAKEMAMLERNEKGKQVRRYFIQVEKKYKMAQELVAKQLQDLAQFMEKQIQFDQEVLRKFNDLQTGQRKNFTVDSITACVKGESDSEKRIKMLNNLVTKMAKACGWEKRFAFHRLYKTLEEVLDISLDDYLEIHQIETGEMNISTLEMLVEYNRLYETAVRLCTNTINGMKCQ